MVIKYLVFSTKSEILNLNWRKLKELEKWFRTEPILSQAERPVKNISKLKDKYIMYGTAQTLFETEIMKVHCSSMWNNIEKNAKQDLILISI